MSSLRNRAIEGLRLGDTFTVTRTFTEEDVLRFGDVSRDYNPVHYDSRFTEARGFTDRICHGLLVASLITEIGGQLGWLASDMNLKFKKPVYMGDTVRCSLTITEMDDRGVAEAQVDCRNQEGVTVLEGLLAGFAPTAKQREIMKAMVEEGDPTNKLAESGGAQRGIGFGSSCQEGETDDGT
jgi:acyl dehydratase